MRGYCVCKIGGNTLVCAKILNPSVLKFEQCIPGVQITAQRPLLADFNINSEHLAIATL